MPKILKEKIPLGTEVRLGIFFIFLFCLIILTNPSVIIKEEIKSPDSVAEISRGDKTRMQVVFTFDGGSEDFSSEKILDVLARHKVKSSFFLTGKFIEKYPDVVRRMYREGHEIYNHTYDHPKLTLVSDEEIVKQFGDTERALYKIIGRTSKPYFRAPYGDQDERVRRVAHGAGYQSVFWGTDALDWQESMGRTEHEVKSLILSTLTPGNIYLMHLGDNITGNILDEMITTIREKGYNIVSLKQGL